jgi:CrcB protein
MAVLGLVVGGALGTLARYLVNLASQALFSGAFPVGTLLVNVVGCYLMGLLTGMKPVAGLSPALHLALGTGFLGAFTTFSTFALDTHTLSAAGAFGRATGYVLANLVLGYLALVVGRVTALRFAS